MKQLEKFKIIATDFLTKNNCNVHIEIDIERRKHVMMIVRKFKNRNSYGLYVSLNTLINFLWCKRVWYPSCIN